MKEYKVIPGPKVIEVKKGDVGGAFSDFGSIINAQAKDGWEYHSMNDIRVAEKAGCFIVKQQVETTFYMLIFSRDVK